MQYAKTLSQQHLIFFRQISLRSSNRNADFVITNALFRLAVQRKYREETSSSFELQQSTIAQAASGVAQGKNTTIPYSFLVSNRTAMLNHFRRIADYLELGPNVWYKVEDSVLTFLDGEGEPELRTEGPTLAHFR